MAPWACPPCRVTLEVHAHQCTHTDTQTLTHTRDSCDTARQPVAPITSPPRPYADASERDPRLDARSNHSRKTSTRWRWVSRAAGCPPAPEAWDSAHIPAPAPHLLSAPSVTAALAAVRSPVSPSGCRLGYGWQRQPRDREGGRLTGYPPPPAVKSPLPGSLTLPELRLHTCRTLATGSHGQPPCTQPLYLHLQPLSFPILACPSQ